MPGEHDLNRLRRDPVELLLRRIARKTWRGTLLTGGAIAAGCGDGAAGDAWERGEQDITMAKNERAPALDAATPETERPPHPTPRETKPEPGGEGPCGGDGGIGLTPARDGGTTPPSEEFDPCTRGEGFPVQAAGLALDQSYDYVAVRQAYAFWDGDSADAGAEETWDVADFETISETGQACATATNGACAEKIARHASPTVTSYCVQACVEWAVVTTRGDEVERWAEPNELLALLGSIDSYDDALMAVASRGYEVTCYGPSTFAPADANQRSVRAVPGGYEVLATRYAETCPVMMRRYRLFVSATGEVQELGYVDFPQSNVCIGRVPAGLRTRNAARAQSALGDHLAQCAHLEAASVHAFVRLAQELRAHGAPLELVERALAAAEDEVRHARAIGALAREHGGELTPPLVERLPTRTLEAIARENAVEGCVRETYGALVGAHQAFCAGDLPLRRAMRSIAEDEARHAALSHDVHTWLMAELDAEAQARVRAAQLGAIAELCAASEQEPERALETRAGLPSAKLARALIAELARELWDAKLAA